MVHSATFHVSRSVTNHIFFPSSTRSVVGNSLLYLRAFSSSPTISLWTSSGLFFCPIMVCLARHRQHFSWDSFVYPGPSALQSSLLFWVDLLVLCRGAYLNGLVWFHDRHSINVPSEQSLEASTLNHFGPCLQEDYLARMATVFFRLWYHRFWQFVKGCADICGDCERRLYRFYKCIVISGTTVTITYLLNLASYLPVYYQVRIACSNSLGGSETYLGLLFNKQPAVVTWLSFKHTLQ